jgi:Zn-dependent protease
MRDPLTWSLPLARLFGIQVRVHILFPLVALGLILRAHHAEKSLPPGVPPGAWQAVAGVIGLLFVSVLLHELGHCFAARRVGGEAQEVLLWPLGGLAPVELPHQARAHFLTAAAGPLVNVLVCVACALLLLVVPEVRLHAPWNPFAMGGVLYPDPETQKYVLTAWGSPEPFAGPSSGTLILVRLFWVNWVLVLLNVVLVAFPMDGGRLFQGLLWPYVGYRQATMTTIFVGFVVALVVALVAIVISDPLFLILAGLLYVCCKKEWFVLETGGEEAIFGDFSQGYTSYEREQAPPRPRQSWFQRWLQRRAARKLLRDQEQREAEERRMDELLEKVQREGLASLTDEERRFLKRVSDRYRNRH